MRKTKSFGIDLDAVLANWEGKGSMFLDIWKERFPKLPFLGVHESKEWYVSENYPDSYRREIQKIYKYPEPGMYTSFPLMDGAGPVLSELSQFGKISIISTPVVGRLFNLTDPSERKKYCEIMNQVSKEKLNWIEEHIAPILGMMPETSFVQDKSSFFGHVLVDDNPHVTQNTFLHHAWEHVLYDDNYLFSKDKKIEFRTHWKDPSCIEKILKASNNPIVLAEKSLSEFS